MEDLFGHLDGLFVLAELVQRSHVFGCPQRELLFVAHLGYQEVFAIPSEKFFHLFVGSIDLLHLVEEVDDVLVFFRVEEGFFFYNF